MEDVSSSGLRYLLDTNIVSELSRTIPDPNVEKRIRNWQPRCAVAVITLEELAFGVYRLPDGVRRSLLAGWLEDMRAAFVTLPYSAAAALWLGRERVRLSTSGRALSRADGEIAAIAVQNDLTLVTRNLSDFQHIAGLRTENWFEA
ncbi:MAG: type II toxin-antitoxin system VapC family toxin [Lautropia sp.]|nr:type II toxin-antitoxin system VapC family toxin [Lautropia sp.]